MGRPKNVEYAREMPLPEAKPVVSMDQALAWLMLERQHRFHNWPGSNITRVGAAYPVNVALHQNAKRYRMLHVLDETEAMERKAEYEAIVGG